MHWSERHWRWLRQCCQWVVSKLHNRIHLDDRIPYININIHFHFHIDVDVNIGNNHNANNYHHANDNLYHHHNHINHNLDSHNDNDTYHDDAWYNNARLLRWITAHTT